LPLLKRARIEIYLPEGRGLYKKLRKVFENEFLYTFGGCTVIREIEGHYLSSNNLHEFDKITLVYADTPFDADSHFDQVSRYTDDLRKTVLEVSSEESVLVAVHSIYHSL
jgi:hypothetical protein